MGFANRYPIPRCQYGVPNYWHPDDTDCGEPAIAYWKWAEDTEPFYVCEEHDRVVEESEGETSEVEEAKETCPPDANKAS